MAEAQQRPIAPEQFVQATTAWGQKHNMKLIDIICAFQKQDGSIIELCFYPKSALYSLTHKSTRGEQK